MTFARSLILALKSFIGTLRGLPADLDELPPKDHAVRILCRLVEKHIPEPELDHIEITVDILFVLGHFLYDFADLVCLHFPKLLHERHDPGRYFPKSGAGRSVPGPSDIALGKSPDDLSFVIGKLHIRLQILSGFDESSMMTA